MDIEGIGPQLKLPAFPASIALTQSLPSRQKANILDQILTILKIKHHHHILYQYFTH